MPLACKSQEIETDSATTNESLKNVYSIPYDFSLPSAQPGEVQASFFKEFVKERIQKRKRATQAWS